MRISDWSSDVCSSDLCLARHRHARIAAGCGHLCPDRGGTPGPEDRLPGRDRLLARLYRHRPVATHCRPSAEKRLWRLSASPAEPGPSASHNIDNVLSGVLSVEPQIFGGARGLYKDRWTT